MGIGLVLSRYISLTDETRRLLIMIIVNIAMPCFILSSIFQFPINEQILKQIGIIFIISLLCNILGIAIGWFVATLTNKSNQKKKEMAILAGLGNTGLIGIPLCGVLYGSKGALFAAVFDAGVNVTVWTIGVILLQKHKTIFSIKSLKTMINMPIIAIIVGLLVTLLNDQPPSIMIQLIDKLANLASPLAMIYIGLLIPILWNKRKAISFSDLGIPIGLKLFLFPLTVTFCLHLFHFEALITKVILVQCTMPVITIASILFAKSSANEELGAAATVYSTLFSLVTIPLMIYLGGELLGDID